MRTPSDLPRPGGLTRFGRRGRNLAVVIVAGSVVAYLVARWIARIVTDSWWFDALQQRAVLSTISRARVELGVVAGFTAAFVLYGCLLVVDRTAPLERPHGHDDQLVARYQVLVAEHGLALRLIVSGLFGAIAALPVAARWPQWLLFRHATPFGQVDAVYGRDLSFYVFRLPFLTFVVEWVFTILVVATLLSAATHYLSGAVQLGPRRAAAGVRTHLSVLLIVMALVRAVAYWLHRYGLVTSQRGYVRGLGYVDEHHVRPALELLTMIALVTAALVVVGMRQRSWRLPIAATASWAVVSVTAGTVFPAVVDRVVARDNPALRERTVIERNVSATHEALGLADVGDTTKPLSGEGAPATAADLRNLADVRLVSSDVAANSMRLAGLVGVGGLAGQPEAGRYVVDGQATQVYIGVGTIDPGSRAGWMARHRLQTAAGRPALVQASEVGVDGRTLTMTPKDQLDLASSGPVYFGEDAPSYAVVAPTDPTPLPPGLRDVSLSSFARRLAFALRFGDAAMVQKTKDSDRVLFVRDVADRVRMLAPFLAWDSNPYPVLADGRLQWVVDGYTTTDDYPSAERADVSGVPRGSGLRRSFNYVRNAVKAVVDAHAGNVVLYVVDDADPILATWRAAFPTLFDSWSQLSPSVRQQARYPSDLLRVQATMWGSYRADDARLAAADEFTAVRGRWTVAPKTLTGGATLSAAPSAAATAAPTTVRGGRTTTTAAPSTAAKQTVVEPSYAVWDGQLVAVSPMVSADRSASAQNLAALVTGTLDDSGRPELRVLRVETVVPSPAAARTSAESAIRRLVPDLVEESLGELQAVPVGTSVAWVLPWYKAANTQLAGVALVVGGRVQLALSVEAAARSVYGIDPGFTTVAGGTGHKASPDVPTDLSAQELLEQARQLYRDAKALEDAGDVLGANAAYDKAFRFAEAAAKASAAAGAGSDAAPVPTTTTTTAPATTTTTDKGWTT